MKSKKTGRKRRIRLVPLELSKELSDPKLVFDAFMECLAEGETEEAREVLAAGLRCMNKTRLERTYRIPRRTAYNLLDRKTLPNLALVAKVCNALRQESLRSKNA